ncbi:MAG: hypothetical protein IJA60_04420 [Clostridia bacterium]|nr:hypothetical protein [Clostridia bacterium]
MHRFFRHCGKPIIPIANETVEALITAAFTIGAAVVAWWKNNSFTNAAIEGDKVMNEIKANNKDEI